MVISTSELRARALAAYETGKGAQSEIAALYGVSTRTFQRWCQKYKLTGSTEPYKRGHRMAVYSGKELKRSSA